jgi:hypothetical protein
MTNIVIHHHIFGIVMNATHKPVEMEHLFSHKQVQELECIQSHQMNVNGYLWYHASI